MSQNLIREIAPEDLKRLREEKSPHTLLDVRETREWDTARIEGAKLVPLSRLASELHAALPSDLTKEEQIVVYCHHGSRSAQVTAWLQEQGYANVYNLTGGINAWSLKVDSSVPRY